MNTLGSVHSASDGNWSDSGCAGYPRGLSSLTGRWICFLHTGLMMYSYGFPRGRCTKTDDAMLARDGAVHESVGLARHASLQGLCVDLR